MSLNPRNVAFDLTVERIAKRVTRRIMYASMILASNAASVADVIRTYQLDESKNDLDVNLTAVCNDLINSFNELSQAIGHAELSDKSWWKVWKENKIEDKIVSYILSDDFEKVIKRLSIYAGMGDRLTEYNDKITEMKKNCENLKAAGDKDGGDVDDNKFKEFAKIVGVKDDAGSITAEDIKKYVTADAAKIDRLAKSYDKIEGIMSQSFGFIDNIIKRCTLSNVSKKVVRKGGEEVPGLKGNKRIDDMLKSIQGEFGDLRNVVDEIIKDRIGDLKTKVEEVKNGMNELAGKDYKEIKKKVEKKDGE